MNERILMAALATVFLVSAVAGAYLIIDIAKVENNVKVRYVEILQNYSCVPRLDSMEPIVKSCVQAGYWYPECPNDTLNLTRWR